MGGKKKSYPISKQMNSSSTCVLILHHLLTDEHVTEDTIKQQMPNKLLSFFPDAEITCLKPLLWQEGQDKDWT